MQVRQMNHPGVNLKQLSSRMSIEAILALALVQLVIVVFVLAGESIYFVGMLGLILLACFILSKTEYGLYVLPAALATPLVLIPAGRIHMGKAVIFLVLCSLFGNFSLRGEDNGISFPRRYVVPLALLLGSNVLSLINADYPAVGMVKTAKLVLAFVFVFGITYYQACNKETLRRMSWAIIAGGLIAACYGVFQYYLETSGIQHGSGIRIFGAVGSVYGAFIGTAIVGIFSILLAEKTLKHSLFFLPLLLPLFFALHLSRTRAWILGTIVAMSAIFLLWIYKRKGFKKLIMICVALFLLCFLLLGVAQDLALEAFAFLFVRSSELSVERASKSVGKAPDLSLLFRYRIWEYAWKVFLQNPLTGVGVGNMRIEDAIRPMKVRPREGIGYTDNHYLNVLVETGILGGIAWVVLLYVLFSSAWKAVRLCNSNQWQATYFAFLGGIIVFLTGGVFWLLTALVYDSAMLAFLFALVFSSEKLLVEEKALDLKTPYSD
jgi:O-antigen ligase